MKVFILFILVCSHLLLLLNTRFTLWPEMAVYPYLLNNGFLLYRDIINPYPPFLSYFLSIFTSFNGYQPPPFHALTISIILSVDALIFFFSISIFKNLIFAAFSVLFFILISIPFGVNGLWFDLVQTPFIITSIYFLAKYTQNRDNKFIITSIIFAIISFFIKQQVVWYLLYLLGVMIFLHRGNIAKIFNILKIPIVFTLTLILLHFLLFFKENILFSYINWGILFSLKNTTLPGYVLLPNLKQFLVISSLLLLLFPAIHLRKKELLLILSVPILIMFSYPRFDYFHLVPAISTLALLIPFLITNIAKKKITGAFFIFGILLLMTFSAKQYRASWDNETRFFENNIIETVQILNEKLPANSKLYVQNGPDQLLVLSSTLPPKPWADEFPWYLEQNNLQDLVVDGINKEKPEHIITKPYALGNKYELGVYKPEAISNYLDDNYTIVDTLPNGLELKKLNDKH